MTQILTAMRSLAVIPVATGVLRAELIKPRQERDEPIRAFAAKVRGKAETCVFTASCECGKDVDYIDHAIRDVILNGIADVGISREVLRTAEILKKPVNDVIVLVENKEMARSASSSSNLSAMSSFQQQQRAVTDNQSTTPFQSAKTTQAPCPHCKTLSISSLRGLAVGTPNPTLCSSLATAPAVQRQQRPESENKFTVNVVDENPISQIAIISSSATHPSRNHQPQRQRRRRKRPWITHTGVNLTKPATLQHHIFTQGEWRRALLRAHPRIDISISLANPHKNFKGGRKHTPNAHTDVSAIVDTGAQSDLWSLQRFLDSGFFAR